MRITMAWQDDSDPGCSPTLVSAYDEYAFDIWGGVPDWHSDALDDAKDGGPIREMVVEIPDDAVRALFTAPTITGHVQEAGA